MEFLNLWAFLGILIIPFVVLIKSKTLPFSKDVAAKIIIKGKISKKTKFYLLITSYILFIIALSRPVIDKGYITIKAPTQNVVIALDVSEEMNKNDLYPNRIEFAKNKIKKLLTYFKSQNVALVLFDKQTYLISPPTKDYSSLIYLLNHTNINELNRAQTSNINNLINSVKDLVKNPKLVIFTANPDIPQNKNIFIYFTSKQQINLDNVISASYSNDNLKELVKKLGNKSKEIKIRQKKELFYYPLFLGILIFLFVIFYPIRRIRWKNY